MTPEEREIHTKLPGPMFNVHILHFGPVQMTGSPNYLSMLHPSWRPTTCSHFGPCFRRVAQPTKQPKSQVQILSECDQALSNTHGGSLLEENCAMSAMGELLDLTIKQHEELYPACLQAKEVLQRLFSMNIGSVCVHDIYIYMIYTIS